MLSVAFGEDIQASLLRCYDGDTCTVDLFDPEGTMPDVVSKAISVRLLGIDTPEKRAVCRLEYCIAIKARDYLVEKLGDNDIMLKNVDRDKYFRLLANLAYFEPSTQTWVGAS
jgi:endonuclease YncB( thermonuclease family)